MNEKGFFLWMQKRKEVGPLDGLWEFPGGKIGPFEDPLTAAIREVKEEVNFDCKQLIPFSVFPYSYSDRQVILNVFYSIQERGDLPTGMKAKWFPINFKNGSIALKVQIPEVNHEIIDDLAIYFKSHLGAESEEFICQ